MFQSILSNIAIILLMHLTMTFISDNHKKIPLFFRKVITVSLVSCCTIILFYLPIRLNENFFVDMRFIPLIFLAYFQGWIAIPALLIASAWRFFMGGAGTVPGIVFGMALPTIIALAFHPRSHLKKHYIEKISIVLLCWIVCDFPIIFIVPNGWEIFKNTALFRVTSFIVTAVILYIFIMQDRQRRFLNSQLEKMADEDPLTKLLNKRKFYEVVEEKRHTLKPKHYIAMLDIDHFKKVNDTYGHLFGDKILVEVANILKKYESDQLVTGRFGGEEFIIYLGETNINSATNLLENIRLDIKHTSFPYKEIESVSITISTGVSEFKDDNILEAVYSADQNLYKAKRSGRDCLVGPVQRYINEPSRRNF